MARIRIKDQDRRPELSIGVVVAAALVAWFAWAMWSADVSVRVQQRQLSQIKVTYQCEDGTRFVAALDTKSRPCPDQDSTARAWPVWTFQCSKDGAFVVSLRYTLDAQQGRPKIKAARAVGFDWQEVDDAILCPRCERVLQPDYTFSQSLASAKAKQDSASADPPPEARGVERGPVAD